MCAAFTDFDYSPYEEKKVWYGPYRVQNRKPQTPQMGDLLEIDRRYYKHWAVYIGDSEVVHKTGNYCSFVLNENGHMIRIRPIVIRRDALHDVVDEKETYGVSNKLGKSMFSPEEIRERALKEVGPSTYNPFTDNCEHFANYCRYNYRCSLQANLLWHDIKHIMFRPSVFVGAMMYMQSTFNPPPGRAVVPSNTTSVMLFGAIAAFFGGPCFFRLLS